MVQHPYIHKGQCVLERAGQHLVGGAGLGGTRGMVVGEDHGCSVVRQCQLDDLARVDAGLGECILTADLLSCP